jgi:hypothetical protein
MNPSTAPALPPQPPQGNKLLNAVGILIALAVSCAVIFYVISASKFDTYFVKQTLSGTVVNEQGAAVAGAKVSLDNNITQTDPTGSFSFAGLNAGAYKLNVQADSYQMYSQDITLNATLPTYSQTVAITLLSASSMTSNGKLITNQSGYQFLDDRIFVGDKEYKINIDGTFKLDLVTGDNRVIFKSVNFVDVVREIKIEANQTNYEFEPITLVPAGDIVGSIASYISQTPVTELRISAEGASQEQITIDKIKNQFRIQDLEIGKQYQIRLSHPNYITRDYTQTVAQGESALFGAAIVEKGRIAYIFKQEGNSNNLQIMSSQWDGGDLKAVTTGRTEPYGEYIDAEEIVYFMSTRDSLSSTLGGRALLAYAIPANGTGNLQRITSNTNGIGLVFPNFHAKLLINITTSDAKRLDRIIEVMDLTGNNRRTLFTLPKGQIYNLSSSFNGTAITFGVKSAGADLDGLYWIDLQTKEVKRLVPSTPLQVFGLSDSGKQVLYSSTKGDNSLRELHVFDVPASSDRRLRTAFTGAQYQFVRGYEDKVIFYDQRSQDTNVYSLDLDDTGDTALTNFKNLEAVEAVYQQNGLIIYQTNKGMYALDFAHPYAGKLVTTKFTRYTGYDF